MGDMEALAEVLWLADGYDLNADPTSSTPREFRPGYMLLAAAVMSSDWLAQHDAARLASCDARLANVWDEAAEATADWMANNPSPSGIPHDPPSNPYDQHVETSQPPGLGEPEGANDGQHTRVHPDRSGHLAQGPDRRGVHTGPGVPDRARPDSSGRGSDGVVRGLSTEGGGDSASPPDPSPCRGGVTT